MAEVPPPISTIHATSLHRTVLAATFVLMVLLGIVTQTSLRAAYEDEVEAALLDTERSAQKLAVRVSEVLDRVDQNTMLVKSLHETKNPMSLDELRTAGLISLGPTRALLTTDRRGFVREAMDSDSPLNFADEPSFKLHRAEPQMELSIGQPHRDTMSGQWVMPVMRSLNRDGIFDGVVIAMVDPGSLTRGFGASEAPDTVVGVLGLDGIYRSRLVGESVTFGEKLGAAKLMEHSAQVRRTLQPLKSPVDGRQRFYTTHLIDRYPLVAVVAVSDSAVSAAYGRTRLRVLGGSAAVAVLILFGAGILWRQARRLEASRREEKRARALYVATLDGSLDAVAIMRAVRGADGQIEDFIVANANRRAGGLVGLDHTTLPGRRLTELVPRAGHDGGLLGVLVSTYQRGKPLEIEAQARSTLLRGRWTHCQVVPVEDGVAVIARDIDDRKRAEEQLAQAARRDPLTQLPNRRHFTESLHVAAERARRNGGSMALICLDLDGFKAVNDQYGHAAGDELLVSVANRLTPCVRSTDLVARLGGDEFAVILEGSGTGHDKFIICERILDALSAPHQVLGRAVVSTPSLGLATYRSGESLDEFCKRADAVMYEAKRAGKACLRLADTNWSPGP
jgi:diguanylate cyclase (GGDEF)-like protein